MKHLLALFFITLSTIASKAQIAEVKVEGSYAKIYNDKGQYTGNSVYIGNNALEGYSNEYLVIKEGSYAKIYDAKGHYTGNSIYIGKNSFFMGGFELDKCRIVRNCIIIKNYMRMRFRYCEIIRVPRLLSFGIYSIWQFQFPRIPHQE